MAAEFQIVHTQTGWFIETPQGKMGPVANQQEADALLAILRTATFARTEMACLDTECFG